MYRWCIHDRKNYCSPGNLLHVDQDVSTVNKSLCCGGVLLALLALSGASFVYILKNVPPLFAPQGVFGGLMLFVGGFASAFVSFVLMLVRSVPKPAFHRPSLTAAAHGN